MPDTGAERARIAALAAELAEVTGDMRFRLAAGVLRGKRGGRPPIDDLAALAFAESLIDAGLTRSRNAACRRAASMYSAGRDKIDITRARLARKLRRK